MKSLHQLIAEHDKSIRDAEAKKINNSEEEYLKKHPKANTKYLPYVMRFQDEVDYFA